MSDPNELETLADLVNGPGWTWFKSYVNAEWGPAGRRFHRLVAQSVEAKDGAVEELRALVKLQAEINALVAAPRERLDQLRQQKKQELVGPSMSRRGPGL